MSSVVIITWVSWSGKTTIADNLISTWKFHKPINFSTRASRHDWEKDDYVFITKCQFESKIRNGDFCQFTFYNGNYYGISKHSFNPKLNYVTILEPVGLAMMEKYLKLNNICFKKIFIDISEVTAIERLSERGDSEKQIKERLQDFKYFEPSIDSVVINWEKEIDEVMKEVITTIGFTI